MKTVTLLSVILRSLGNRSHSSTIKFNLIFLVLITAFIFIPSKSECQTDTLICDNGGFESNFTYYFGKTATFDAGSNTCTPTLNGNPVTWASSSLPAFRRFEIATTGLDTLSGINRVKFGSKSLLLNNRYSHTGGDICDSTYRDINKLVKRFKVTEANRDFTVWFAVILETPAGHSGNQPYFSIECDLAPNSDLCFDAAQLECTDTYADTICEFPRVDVVDWSCHRIKIPKSEIGNIATLEISAADCGLHAHFGYAYIDGICEECEGSALGSVTLYEYPWDCELGIQTRSCEGDTIRICGTYTLPTVCGTWDLDSIKAPGYDIYNVEIDEGEKTFCFDIAKSDFPEDSCVDLYVVAYFSSNLTTFSEPLSNSIEICDTDFQEFGIDVTTGICQDNGTSNLLSDDYYYVSVELAMDECDTFTIHRTLDDPYPNESGHYILETGTGSGTYDLGPILIQEGSWELVIDFGDCSDTFEIEPPSFCSGCSKFRRVKISNITCINGGSDNDPTNDTWSYDINVPGLTGTYQIDGAGMYSYGSTVYTINKGTIGHNCILMTLSDLVLTGCTADFIVCPPKPCPTNESCELEVYVTDVYCDNEDTEFYVELNVTGGASYLCYKASKASDNSLVSQGSFSSILGPFTEDIWLEVKICTTAICTCSVPSCFKVIYVPFPDCDNLEFRSSKILSSNKGDPNELLVIPNPINGKELLLRSSLKTTSFEFFNSSAKLIFQGNFIGTEYRLSLDIPAGLYFVRYKNNEGKYNYLKVIKL